MLSFGMTQMPDPPHQRLVDLFQLGEANGFTTAWIYDSHILWQEPYPLLTLIALNTERMNIGLCVTNPGTRHPTVTASAMEVLNDISGGRMVVGIGRGDSARRVIGMPPVTTARLERAAADIKALSAGEKITADGHEIQIPWASHGVPVYVAGYGPKVLGAAGRVADGIILQIADPDIIQWCIGLARRGAEEVGRDPDELKVIACAPGFISDDIDHAREQVRWFPAMVGNHVVDLIRHHEPANLPPVLTDYVRERSTYDYAEHSRVGARHGESIPDEIADRFCVIGSRDDCVAKLRQLEEIGVDEWNLYVMTEGKEELIEAYGSEIIPEFDRPTEPAGTASA
jgi:probable F420-dependent oxidoreductase